MQSSWMSGAAGHGGGLIVGLAFAVAILLLRNRKPRPLKIKWLWVRPVSFGVMSAAALIASPPPLDATSCAVIALAIVVGAGLGWQRGRFIHIDVHPETHDLTTRVSPIGLLFIVAIVIGRFGLRAGASSVSRLHISLVAVSDAIVLLLGAMMVAQGTEIFLRARKVLAEARGVGARTPTSVR